MWVLGKWDETALVILIVSLCRSNRLESEVSIQCQVSLKKHYKEMNEWITMNSYYHPKPGI